MFKQISKILVKNAPTILTTFMVGGVITTSVLTGQAAVKASKEIDEIETHEGVHLGPKAKIKLVWKYFIPATLSGVITISSGLGANYINNRRNAVLMSLYTVANKGFKEYKSKVIEVLGEKKHQEVKESLYNDKIKNFDDKTFIVSGGGDVICYDAPSDRYFKNDIEQIRRIENDLNRDLLIDMFISINDFYYAIGLSGIQYGDDIGWNVDNPIRLSYTSKLTKDNQPCLVIDYDTEPKKGFGV